LHTRPLDERQLGHLLDLLRRVSIQIDDYFPLGRPAVELVRATATIKPEALGQLAEGLVQAREMQLHGFRVFPRGLPPAEREFVVQLEITGAPQQ
jgi:hypothetical protein